MSDGSGKVEEITSRHKESVPEDRHSWYTFDQYMDMVYDDPYIVRNAHQRLADMFEHYGTSYDDVKERVEYCIATEDPLGDGSNRFFGTDVHDSIHDFVNKIKGGARGLGPEKRITLLLGPVGSGKSDFDKQVRHYFEHYTKQEAGRMFTFRWVDLCSVIEDQDPQDDTVQSPMNQDPLTLLPEEHRPVVFDDLNERHDEMYTLSNEQSLDPESAFYMGRLLEHYNEDLQAVLDNHIEVVRLVASENQRNCVETFEPKDKKNQDETELTGGVDYSKIGVYGESDPRAFDYAGAFCNANRGIFSGEELLKLQREFLYNFLHATQEQTIKPRNNPRIDIDQVIVGRTNMPEYQDKKDDEKMEALNDRTKRVDFPYTLEFSEEAKIYQKILNNADTNDVYIEPHTLEMAALFAVLTRLQKPDAQNVTIVQKAKAYNGSHEDEDIDVEKLRNEVEDEGLYGVSARFIGDEISESIIDTLPEDSESVSGLTVLNHLDEHMEKHGSIPQENFEEYHNHIERAQDELLERCIEDVRHALAYDVEEISRQGEKYMDNVVAYIDDDTVEDELTGESQEPDETFMRSVEEELDIPEDRKDDFRQEITNWVSRRARKGTTFEPHDNDQLRRALERKNWNDKKHNINFSALVSSNEMDEDDRSAWIDSLKEQGYSEEGAIEALEFAGAEVARSEMENNE